jgi:hypothetical protein
VGEGQWAACIKLPTIRLHSLPDRNVGTWNLYFNLSRNFLATIMGLRANLSALKNAVFWDVMLRGSCKNRRFGGT